MLCDGDATSRPGNWTLFSEQRLKKYPVKWIYYPEQDQSLGYGFWDLGETPMGVEYRPSRLFDCLIEINRFSPIEGLFWEQKFRSEGNYANDLASKLIGVIEMFAVKRRPRFKREIPTTAWPDHFVGRIELQRGRDQFAHIADRTIKNAKRRKVKKSLTMQRASSYGMKCERDDEADAIGILDYAVSTIVGRPVPWSTDEALRAPLSPRL